MLFDDLEYKARYDRGTRTQQARLCIRTRLAGFSLLLATAVLASCAGAGISIERPAVTLSGVEMSSLSFSGQTFLLSFDVNNPTAHTFGALSFTASQSDLRQRRNAGRFFGSGKWRRCV